MNDVCMDLGESKQSENQLKKEHKFGIQEIMHSQYKCKADNRYLSFHERLCKFNQNKSNRIIESDSDELIMKYWGTIWCAKRNLELAAITMSSHY